MASVLDSDLVEVATVDQLSGQARLSRLFIPWVSSQFGRGRDIKKDKCLG